MSFSLQPLIKGFAKGKTQHVISIEDRDHGPNGRTGTRIGTGRTAAGRAGSFNPEEHRSSRLRPLGPSLREELLRSSSSGDERTGPEPAPVTDGGPARITQCEQAGAGWGERVADRTTEKDRGSGGDVSAAGVGLATMGSESDH